MEYITHVLGIRVTHTDDALKPEPDFIHARYWLRKAMIDMKEVIFVYPKTDLDPVSAIKKHIARIEHTEGVPAVLILDHLTYRQKEYLLRDHIPFVVEGKQIYLPFLAVYLQERGCAEQNIAPNMLPAAQLLLLYYIYSGCGELLTSKASQALGFTPTSISRASRQLEYLQLIQRKQRGVQKVINSDKSPQELFLAAERFLCNPIKRTVYIPKREIKENLLLSGYSALSEYSMMNPPSTDCMAVDSIACWKKILSERLQNADDQCAVEFWRYDPKKLSHGECVDRLSLAIALRDDKDERIEKAVEEMLGQVWRDIDDKRN